MITKYPFELQGLMNPQSFVMNPFTKDKYKNELETLKILLQLQNINKRLEIIEKKLQSR